LSSTMSERRDAVARHAAASELLNILK
jgi:hypothetical protein